MNIFVTGGTGFIGSHFINMAHKAGHNLLCLKRKISNARIDLDIEPNWIIGSLDNKFNKRIFEKIDVFIHLAGHSTNPPYDSLQNCLYWNVNAPLNLFEIARQAGVHRFIVAGSCFEYGNSGENYDFIPPNAPLKPLSTYAISKASSSFLFSRWAIINSIEIKYLRIFHVFGEGELNSRFWPSLRRAAFDGIDFPMTFGNQKRDFVHVSKVVERFINELDFNKSKKGTPLVDNIGSGKVMTLKEFAEYWWDFWHAKGKLKFGDIPYRNNEVMRYVPLLNNNNNQK